MTLALNYRRPRRTMFARSTRWKGHIVHLLNEDGDGRTTICNQPTYSIYIDLRHNVCVDCMRFVREPKLRGIPASPSAML